MEKIWSNDNNPTRTAQKQPPTKITPELREMSRLAAQLQQIATRAEYGSILVFADPAGTLMVIWGVRDGEEASAG